LNWLVRRNDRVASLLALLTLTSAVVEVVEVVVVVVVVIVVVVVVKVGVERCCSLRDNLFHRKSNAKHTVDWSPSTLAAYRDWDSKKIQEMTVGSHKSVTYWQWRRRHVIIVSLVLVA
jgi:hypothetical protein